jgi:hypothetical protein
MRFKKTVIVLGIALLHFQLQAQSLNARMSKAVKDAIGKDISKFKTFSYPTDNYGVITSYEKRVNQKKLLCDTWHCIGLQKAPKDAESWLTVNGYVIASGGGPITLDEETKKTYALSIALPKIADILNVSSSFNNTSTQHVSLILGRAYKRDLLKDSLIKYFKRPDVESSAKEAFTRGTLRFITSDLVIENMTVEVTLDANTTATLEAKLGDSNSKVFDDASLSFKLERVEKGTYKFSIDKPVIYAYLSKRQPTAGKLGASKFFDDWTDDTANFPPDPTMLKHKKPAAKPKPTASVSKAKPTITK